MLLNRKRYQNLLEPENFSMGTVTRVPLTVKLHAYRRNPLISLSSFLPPLRHLKSANLLGNDQEHISLSQSPTSSLNIYVNLSVCFVTTGLEKFQCKSLAQYVNRQN